MINVTLEEILTARNDLAALCGMKLPLRESYTVSKLVKKANAELEAFDDSRRKIISEFDADEDADKTSKKLEEQIMEAMRETVDLPVNKINAERIEKLELTPKQVTTLIPFIDFGDDED